MKSVKLPGSQWWYSVFLEFYKSFQPSGYLKLLVFKCWPLLKARVVKIELRKFEFRSFTILTWSCWRLLRWKEAKSSRYRAQRSQTLKDFTVVRTVINFMSRKNHRWKFFASISPPTWPSWHYKQGKIFHFVLCLFDRITKKPQDSLRLSATDPIRKLETVATQSATISEILPMPLTCCVTLALIWSVFESVCGLSDLKS